MAGRSNACGCLMSEPVSDTRTLHRRAEPQPSTQALAGSDTRTAMLPGSVDGDAIYRRTRQGEKELEQPGRRISRAAHRALNLFDGARPLRELPRIFDSAELPSLLRELLDANLIRQVGSDAPARKEPHPDTALARVKRALAGAFIRELGPAGSVLEARVQDCVNLVVLHNVLQEITGLVAERKNAKAAERIRAIVRDHGLK